MKYSAAEEKQLMTDILALAEKPHELVKFIYPWGKTNTPLAQHDGPRTWQLNLLEDIGGHIIENRNRMLQGQNPKVFQDATVSGRGIGRSAEFAWLNHWFMSTVLGGTVIVTANTEAQLKSRTWPEFGKWLSLAINAHWFEKSATSIRPQKWFQEILLDELGIDSGYYYSQAQPWSEENPDAFAGAHNPHGIMVLYDEGSNIPAPIWNVTSGFFTEPVLHRYWLAFSNGRRASGPFFECFHKNRDFWRNRHIDARTVEGTDKDYYDQIIAQHGEDSDVARVEVKGQFPRTGQNQFIGRDVVAGAQHREVVKDRGAPLIIGVDVARFGDDSTVIRFRQGRDARTIPPVQLKGKNNMQVAYKVAEIIDEYNPDAVNIDAGAGAGVIDRLRDLGYKVNEIWFGSKADPESKYFNMRTQMWGRMADWLSGGCIDKNDQRLEDDLTGPEYYFAGKDGDRKALESKDDMKKRGLASPDDGDALALTFAVRVPRKNITASRHKRKNKVAKDVDYDIFG